MKKFSVGDEIEHKLFGRGVVAEVPGFGRGNDVKLKIKFDKDDEYKIIISKFVKLIK